MGKDAGSAPPPVDPNVTANAQTNSNIQTAQEQQRLGMVNTSGPGGSVSYINDPTAPGGYKQITQLGAGSQSIYDLGQQAQAGALGTANDQIGRINTALNQNLTTPNLATGYQGGAPLQTGFDTGGPLQSSFNPGQAVQGSVGPNDFSADRDATAKASYDQATSRLDPQWQTSEDHLDSKLANQGLSANSSASINARDQFGRDKNDAYSSAENAAQATGNAEQQALFNEALQQGGFANSAAAQQYAQNAGQAGFGNQVAAQAYGQNQGAAQFNNAASAQQDATNQSAANFGNMAQQQNFQNTAFAQNLPISQFATLMGNGSAGVQQPSAYSGSSPGVSPTDVLGAYGLNAQGQQNAYNAKVSQTNATNQGTTSALTAAAMAAMYMFSERDLKRDIIKIADRPDGLGVYRFNYKSDPDGYPVRFGVMADEVERVMPDAVKMIDGHKAVDYARI